MKKHAYLIMCHGNIEMLNRLLKCLDDMRNDIFIHIDIKAGIVDYKEISTNLKCSKVFFLKRMNVAWGAYSQIECELNLIEEAIERENYSYLHLLSGADLPIKSQNFIHDFFLKNLGKEFIHFETNSPCGADRQKYVRYHLFQQQIANKKNLLYYIQRLLVHIQEILNVDRQKKSILLFGKGANWFSITEEFAKYVLSKKNWIKKTFKYTLCCDEIFMQTLVLNSAYVDNLYYQVFDNDYTGNMRFIIWENKGNDSHPYTFVNEDIKILEKSDKLFARKFDKNFKQGYIDRLIERK